jgi:hypothetical protein
VRKSDAIAEYKKFTRDAHRLLNWLAGFLKLLPDEISVKGVVLLSAHPINHGGFSNIYHGRYKNSEGKQVEVALKVLKIFEDQSDEERLILHAKFTKEVLVWRSLKRESTAFPESQR